MAKMKSLAERYADEILTDNSVLNHNAQCKDCFFRDKTMVDGQEFGWQKCVCHIYGKISASRTNKDYPNFFDYTPTNYEDKPSGVYENTEVCEYYEKEKAKKK